MHANWTHPQLFCFLDQLDSSTPYLIFGGVGQFVMEEEEEGREEEQNTILRLDI